MKHNMKWDKRANKAAHSHAEIVRERHLAQTFAARVVSFEQEGTFGMED